MSDFGTGIGNASDIFGDLTSYDDNEEVIVDDDDFDTADSGDTTGDDNSDDDTVENEDEPESSDNPDDTTDSGDTGEVDGDSHTDSPSDYVDVVKTLAGMQLGLFDAEGNPVEAGNLMVDVAARYESQLKFQKLENDILRLTVQDEDFNEVAPTFAQTVVNMPELLQYENGAEVLYNIAKANYIQSILPEVVEEIVAERMKERQSKQAFQSTTSKGGSPKPVQGDIVDGIMAEAQRRAKLF